MRSVRSPHKNESCTLKAAGILFALLGCGVASILHAQGDTLTRHLFRAASPSSPFDVGNAADWLHSQTALNGLQSMDLQPWHIVIAYDQFDKDGDHVHSGILEEYWAGPKKYRISYKSDTLNQTDYATDRGLFRLGDQRWPNPTEAQVRTEVVDPFTNLVNLRNFHASSVERTFGPHILHCVVFDKPGVIDVPEKYCFDPGTSLRSRRRLASDGI
jgi:hypothetical protein